MKLTVVFEHWHLGDGNYPAFAVGDEARLSFELDVLASEPAAPDAPESVRQLRDAEYEVTASVLRLYDDGLNSPFPVFEAAWLRFYSPSQAVSGLAQGSRVRLRGTFALDHYLWVEFLDRYPDPPDLFYNVRVARVRRVAIPAIWRKLGRSRRLASAPRFPCSISNFCRRAKARSSRRSTARDAQHRARPYQKGPPWCHAPNPG